MKDPFRSFNSGRVNFYLLAVIAFILITAALKITAQAILPFVIAVLLAFMLHPLVSMPGRFRVPRLISILLAVIFIIAGLGFIGVVLFSSVRSILSLYPSYENRLTEIYLYIGRFFNLSYDENLSIIQNLWAQLGIRTRIQMFTFSLSNSFVGFLRDALMVVIFMVFMLLEAVFFKEKVDTAFSGRSSSQIKKIGGDIMIQVSRYLAIKFLISLATGVIVAAGLSLIGLKFAILWGIIQFILNFIPFIGSIVVGACAGIFALIQFWPDPAPIIAVVLVMIGTNVIIGNILEPKIMGDNLGLSPIVVLLSLIAWGYIWGIAGMIIAVPMMMITKIVSENVRVLEPLSVILGSRKAVLAKKLEYDLEAAEAASEAESEAAAESLDEELTESDPLKGDF